MHHVQDAANPAHTRDDAHPLRDDLHLWAAAEASGMITGIGGSGQNDLPLPAFDTTLFNQSTVNQHAPIPIARVIDATDGDRTTLSTGHNIGIAEYSNANFFSDDTVFSQSFLFPNQSQLESFVDSATNETYLRFTSGSGGQTDYKVAHTSALKLITNEAIAPTDKLLDDAVMFDYAKKLLPRAVSYSKGLIEYFFRGTLNGFGPCGHPVAEFPSTWYPWTADATLSALSHETAGAGELRVVMAYTLNGVTSIFSSDPVQVNFAANPNPVVDFRFHTGVPFNGATYPYARWIVFKGQLGQEPSAVVVGRVDSVC
jgi:hypothetical protein